MISLSFNPVEAACAPQFQSDSSNKPRYVLLPIPLILAWISPVCSGRTLQAQDDEVVVVQAAPVMSDENFNQLIFRNQGNAQTARKRMDTMLVLRTEAVNRVCSLSDAQKKKLQLAGRGDIKRLFDQVEEIRKKFKAVQNDRNRIGEVLQEGQNVQRSIDALFGSNSIFEKTMRNTLTTEQYDKYEKIERDRQAFSYGAKIEMAVAMLDNTLPLRDDQRLKLAELLLDESKPPKRSLNSNYDYYFVMIQMARIPPDKLRPLFDDAQWRIISRLLEQMKAREPQLRQAGVLD
jgi:hypothetical protein